MSDKLLYPIVLMMALIAAYVIGRWDDSEAEQTIRGIFHLPADATFADIETIGTTRSGVTSTEAVIEFSAASFAAYLESLNDPDVWQPVAFSFSNHAYPNGPYSALALQWHEGQDAWMLQSDLRIRQGRLEHKVGWPNIIDTLSFCFSMVETDAFGFGRPPEKPFHDFIARACTEFTSDTPRGLEVRAFIDRKRKLMVVSLK